MVSTSIMTYPGNDARATCSCTQVHAASKAARWDGLQHPGSACRNLLCQLLIELLPRVRYDELNELGLAAPAGRFLLWIVLARGDYLLQLAKRHVHEACPQRLFASRIQQVHDIERLPLAKDSQQTAFG